MFSGKNKNRGLLLKKAAENFDVFISIHLNYDESLKDNDVFNNIKIRSLYNSLDIETKKEFIELIKNYYLKGCYDMFVLHNN